MALVRLLELEARVRRVKEYNQNDLRDAARDVLMITGAGAALAERGRRKRAWLDAFDRSTLVSGDPSDAIEWFRPSLAATLPSQRRYSPVVMADHRYRT
jgi:hypothetical protein